MTLDRPPAATLDWSVGHYEITAAQLAPAAQEVVRRAAVRPGEQVVDLGCGTGNAALLAAGAGATVIGVDPAPRLLEVARSRAAAEGTDVEFVGGDAASLPVMDSTVHAILSVFGVVFAPDPGAAASEMSRALRPRGRIVLSAWMPTGALYEMYSAIAQAVRRAVGAPPPPKPFAWHDRHALHALFGPRGFHLELEEHRLAFTARSVEEYLERECREHPAAVAGMAVLEGIGRVDALRSAVRRILSDGNEDPSAFGVTSRYVVATLTRDASDSRPEAALTA